ncbi:hypothetical protein Tco_0837014 [Tanacetum coccineum]
MVFHNEDGNPASANIKQALGRPHKGVKAFANSDVMYFFTSAQDGNPVQDDVRLCLGNDLKKAQDHSGGMYRDGGSGGSMGDDNAAVTASMIAWVDVILSVWIWVGHPADGSNGGDGDEVGHGQKSSSICTLVEGLWKPETDG